MSDEPTAPGDEAAPGTPGTGEHDGIPCPVWDGTGKVTEGLAGG